MIHSVVWCNIWSFGFLFIRSFGFGPSSFKNPSYIILFCILMFWALSPSRNIIHLFLLTIFTKELTYGISTGEKNITLLIKTTTEKTGIIFILLQKKLQRGINGTGGGMNETASVPKSIHRCKLDNESNFFSGIQCFLDNFQDLPNKSSTNELNNVCHQFLQY